MQTSGGERTRHAARRGASKEARPNGRGGFALGEASLLYSQGNHTSNPKARINAEAMLSALRISAWQIHGARARCSRDLPLAMSRVSDATSCASALMEGRAFEPDQGAARMHTRRRGSLSGPQVHRSDCSSQGQLRGRRMHATMRLNAPVFEALSRLNNCFRRPV